MTKTTNKGPKIRFRGANWDALESDAPECLLAGPAGTGKTVVMLWKVRHLAETYPGCRVLICRKTRASLTETALVTFETQVLGADHKVLTKHPTLRRVRQSYRFPNGSEVVVAGLDKPDKVLSAEYDAIYCQEATELTLTDWETLSSRLRNGKTPCHQMLADCNPTTPNHWLYKRHLSGTLKLFRSRHKDNPRFYSLKRKDWTAAGREYRGRLDRLTGVRRKRFLKGIWSQAEGLVFDTWDAERNLIDPFPIPIQWKRYVSIDFGFSVPFCAQWWAADGDGRIYLYREIYKSKTLVEDHAKMIRKHMEADPLPVVWICDPADAEGRATLERHLRIRTTAAKKDTAIAGVQETCERMAVSDDDNKPRLFIFRDARCHPVDQVLHDLGRPTCTAEEIDGWVWNDKAAKDQPVDKDNHGADSCRYLCRYLADRPPVQDDIRPASLPLQTAIPADVYGGGGGDPFA